MAERAQNWLQRNWVALWAVICFLFALLQLWKWLESRSQDAALETVFNVVVGIAFLLVYRNRRNEEAFRRASKQLTNAFDSKK